MKKRLSEVEVGKTVFIHSFDNTEMSLKLLEMGCVPGEAVTVDTIAPMGDPISITVSGYHLSLRIDEAETIWTESL